VLLQNLGIHLTSNCIAFHCSWQRNPLMFIRSLNHMKKIIVYNIL